MVTSTMPTDPTGEVAVTELDEPTVKAAGAVPKSTALAPVKPEPVMVTVVPPAGRPAAGLSVAMDGAAS